MKLNTTILLIVLLSFFMQWVYLLIDKPCECGDCLIVSESQPREDLATFYTVDGNAYIDLLGIDGVIVSGE